MGHFDINNGIVKTTNPILFGIQVFKCLQFKLTQIFPCLINEEIEEENFLKDIKAISSEVTGVIALMVALPNIILQAGIKKIK